MEGFHHLRLMLLDSAMFVSCLGWDKIYVHPVINITCTNKGVAYQDRSKCKVYHGRLAGIWELIKKCWIVECVQVPLPRTIIALAKAEVEEPKFGSPDPVLVITDRNTSTNPVILTCFWILYCGVHCVQLYSIKHNSVNYWVLLMNSVVIGLSSCCFYSQFPRLLKIVVWLCF